MISKTVLLQGDSASVPELLTQFVLLFLNEAHSSFINVNVDGRQFRLDIQLSTTIDDADVVLLCFGINNPVSFHKIFRDELKLIKSLYPSAHIILVGIQNNTPDDMDIVRSEDARVMAKNINAINYIESRFDSKESFTELLTAAARAPIITRTIYATPENRKKPKNSSCQVL